MANESSSAAAAQRELLSLIRGVATERSQGERRVSDLRKKLLELQADYGGAIAALDRAKRKREESERELRASELQLSLADASAAVLQSRIALLQEEISKLRVEVDSFKDEEGAERELFLNAMYELNSRIREFQKMAACVLQDQCPLLQDEERASGKRDEVLATDTFLKGGDAQIRSVDLQLQSVETEYNWELQLQEKILLVLATNEQRWVLLDAIIQETKNLQELGWQTSELEKMYASLGEELQRKCICPGCQFNNMGKLKETSQTNVDN